MNRPFIDDRGRGPEISGTRITVDTLLPHFLDPEATEDFICGLYELNAEQVAAARAYILNNPDVVLSKHLQIEARTTPENPPEVIERAKKTREIFSNFKEWLHQRDHTEASEQDIESKQENGLAASGSFPSFQEWLAERESRSAISS